MLQMMKRDFLINSMYFLIVLFVIPFVYLLDFSPIFIYMAVIFGCVFNIFYYDDHNHVSRAIVSMPIRKNKIVLARYLFLIMMINFYMLYLWMIDVIVHHSILSDMIPSVSYKTITSITIFLSFLIISIGVAVSVPIFYFFQSFIKSLLAQFALLMLAFVAMSLGVPIFGKYLDLIPESFVMDILDLIKLQPVLFILIFSLICLFISYKLSVLIFSRRDIV